MKSETMELHKKKAPINPAALSLLVTDFPMIKEEKKKTCLENT